MTLSRIVLPSISYLETESHGMDGQGHSLITWASQRTSADAEKKACRKPTDASHTIYENFCSSQPIDIPEHPGVAPPAQAPTWLFALEFAILLLFCRLPRVWRILRSCCDLANELALEAGLESEEARRPPFSALLPESCWANGDLSRRTGPFQ